MPSKRFQDMPCAYCAKGISTTTGDHVLPRSLVPKNLRGNLPKVPCCRECNRRKARTEHYIASVLPFGGRHGSARETLELAGPRIAKNDRLAKDLAEGLREHVTGSGHVVQGLLIETEQVECFVDDLVRGLSNFHWSDRLTEPSQYFSALLHQEIDEWLAHWLGNLKGDSVSGDLAEGHVRYLAKRAPADPIFSMWRIEFLGNMQFAGDGPSLASAFWAVGGDPRMVDKFKQGIREPDVSRVGPP